MMYNKYTSKLRLLFAPRPDIITSGYQTATVSIKFSENSKITGIFGGADGVSQPMDQKSDAKEITGVANLIPAGWSHAEFDVAYDPCTCMSENIGNTYFDVQFTGIETASVDMTGVFIGTESGQKELFSANGNYDDVNRLMSVLGNGADPKVGTETYKTIDGLVEQAKQAQGNTFISNLTGILDNFLPVFSVGTGIAFDLFKIGSGTWIENGEGDDDDVSYSKGIKTIASISKSFNSILKQFNGPKKSFPTVIQGEMALSGAINNENPSALTTMDMDYVIDNPGTSPADNEEEFGAGDLGAYPIYNEVLGRFALLKTPVVKYSILDESVVIPQENGATDITSCQGVKSFKLSEGSIQYVFNPAANINIEETEIIAALSIVNAEGILQPGKYLEAVRPAFTPAGCLPRISYITPFLPLECLSDITIPFVISDSVANYVSNPCDYFFGELPIIELRLIINYVFNELNSNGNPNRAVQILTYPVTFEEVEEGSLTDGLAGVTIGDLELSGFIDDNVTAFGKITIVDDISTSGCADVDIIANEIIVPPDVHVPDGFNLLIGTPPQCGDPIPPSSIDLNTYCTDGTYKANQTARLSYKKMEQKEIEENNKLRVKSYPNPHTASFTVEFFLQEVENVEISIKNDIGQIVYTNELVNTAAGKNTYTMSGHHWANGIYFLTIQTDKSINTIKIIRHGE